MRLKPTPEYEANKAALSRNARTTLTRIVEPAIAEDPYHTVRRHHRSDGTTADYSADELIVVFRVLGSVVELLVVIDLQRAPRWP